MKKRKIAYKKLLLIFYPNLKNVLQPTITIDNRPVLIREKDQLFELKNA